MSGQVKVEDFEVFSLFRVAVLKFAQAADQALSSADSQIARTHSWLEGEQASYWQGQLRKRIEAVTKAREVLRQKKLYKDSSGRVPDASQEEKALAQCLAAVTHAEGKLEAIRKWLPKLENAAGVYRGGVSPLNRTITGDIPKAIALLDHLAAALEEYVQIENSGANMPESADSSTRGEPMSRGGDSAAATTDGPSASEPASKPEKPAQSEGRDVVNGQ